MDDGAINQDRKYVWEETEQTQRVGDRNGWFVSKHVIFEASVEHTFPQELIEYLSDYDYWEWHRASTVG